MKPKHNGDKNNMSNILNTLKNYQSSFVSFEAETEPKLAVGKFQANFGKHPKEVKLVKFAKVVGLIGTKVNYQDLVQNRLIKEADLKGQEATDFKAESLPDWKERVDGVETRHKSKGTQYITVHCVANNVPKVRYELDGKELSAEEITLLKECLPKSSSKKQEEAGIEKPVIYREYKVQSMKQIKVGGEVITD